MSAHATMPDGHPHHVSSPISVPWVIVASLAAAAGLLLLWQAVTTMNPLYFLGGPILVLIGTLMFLNDRAGLDHA
jgi:hypothetical protein